MGHFDLKDYLLRVRLLLCGGLPAAPRRPVCHYTGKRCEYEGAACTCLLPDFQGAPPTWTDGVDSPDEEQR
jgi:hypothetical protein